MNRVLDTLAAIGATVLVFVIGWIVLYPLQRNRDEWTQIKRGRWIRK